ncbi:class I glutamine amidotransferase-like protein [Ceratobasidium sp. AG-I]|nr:class I glutamine amidotransferase-like protein [Ceratobasidium sp. AG-I]
MIAFLKSPLYAVVALFFSYIALAKSGSHVEGPIELLGSLSKGSMVQNSSSGWPFSPYEVIIDYVADTKDPIIPVQGPPIYPTKTLSEVNGTQYDLILVPGGMGTRPQYISPTIVDFVRTQTPGLQYLLSVCTGSWVLAAAGVLDGKNATTNKAAFKQVKAATSPSINWVAKARWVVDGTTWTSSGVTAGADMAYAFLTHLAGPDFAIRARNTIELRAASQDDDPFAEIWGLLDD